MMKLSHLALVVVLCVAISFSVVQFAFVPAKEAARTETLLEKIKRTGVLRCGYSIWPPAMIQDPNTGAYSGIFYDLLEEIGKQLGVKIEWTIEVNPAHMFADLDSGRIDMVCSSYIATPARAKAAAFTPPIFYNQNILYARANDTRFDGNAMAANNPTVKFAVVDGGLSSILTGQKFPLAQKEALPEFATPADTFLYVASGKADLIISEPLSFALFNAANPGKLKRVTGEPLWVYGAGMPMPKKEYDFHDTINATLAYLQSTGFVDAVFSKYETEGAKTLRVARPYSPDL